MAMEVKSLVEYFQESIGGKVGLGLYDFNSGLEFFVNKKEKFTAASLSKLFIVSLTLKKVRNGVLALNDQFLINEGERVGGTGVIHLLTQRTYTLHDLCMLAIIESDNTAANKLIDVVGGLKELNEYIINLGLADTKVTHKFMLYKGEPTSTTSVRDLIRFFTLLVRGELEMSKEFKEILLEQKNRFRAAALIKAPFGLKTADLPHPEAVVHDAGVIFDPAGEIILIILTEGSTERKKTMMAMAKLAAEIYGEVVWDVRLKKELKEVKKITSPTDAKPDSCNFGKKATYGKKYWGRHLALDFQAREGEPIKAMAEGKVVYSSMHPGSKEHQSYGGVVIIAHKLREELVFSLYGHLGNRFVEAGELVKSGQVIGVIGKKFTPQNGCWVDHLHFGIYKGVYRGGILPGYQPPGKLSEWMDPTEFLGIEV